MIIKKHSHRGASLVDYYSDISREGTLLAYRGAFTREVISDICVSVKRMIAPLPPSIGKKIFAVFIEMVQNIAYHSSERSPSLSSNLEYGVGQLIIEDNIDVISITTINRVDKKSAVDLEIKCNKINELSRSELREYKRELRLRPVKKSNCANIGLVQMSLTSNLGVIFELKEERDWVIVGISMDIKKEIQ